MEEYEGILESLKQLLRDGNAFIPGFRVIFSTLSDINQEYRKFKTENDSDDHAMEQACILVLQGDFIVIKCRVAFFSTVHKEIKTEKSKLPERVHPIVEEIEVYFAMMDEHLEKLNATVQKMLEKVRNVKNIQNKLGMVPATLSGLFDIRWTKSIITYRTFDMNELQSMVIRLISLDVRKVIKCKELKYWEYSFEGFVLKAGIRHLYTENCSLKKTLLFRIKGEIYHLLTTRDIYHKAKPRVKLSFSKNPTRNCVPPLMVVLSSRSKRYTPYVIFNLYSGCKMRNTI